MLIISVAYFPLKNPTLVRWTKATANVGRAIGYSYLSKDLNVNY